MEALIDWAANYDHFDANIRDMISRAQKDGCVIPLPIQPNLSTLTAILAQVNCTSCTAPCCRINPPTNQPISIVSIEYETIKKKVGTLPPGMTPSGIPIPCPFLQNYHCSIYDCRPLVCVMYPFDQIAESTDGKMMALSSNCPESARIAQSIYRQAYYVRRKSWELKIEAGIADIWLRRTFKLTP